MLLRQELSPTSVGCVGNEVAEQLQEGVRATLCGALQAEAADWSSSTPSPKGSLRCGYKSVQQTNYIVVYIQSIFSTSSTSSPTS
jgi:hypothetical protein